MTTRDPRPLLAAISPRRDEQARALGTTVRTIQRWLSGYSRIPEPVWLLMVALAQDNLWSDGRD